MTQEFRKGDVCSLEVVVSDVHDDGTLYVVTDETPIDNSETLHVYANAVTLIRRAPVDLASCDLPVEARWVNSARPVTITQRGKTRAIIELSDGSELAALLSDLRPDDAPAPAGSTTGCYLSDLDHYLSQARDGEPDVRVSVQRLREWREAFNALYYGPRPSWAPKHDAPAPAAEAGEAERLRARVAEIEGALSFYAETAKYKAPFTGGMGALWEDCGQIAKKALASTAPSSPPGHVLINGHVVPEPMREAPAVGTKIWLAHPFCNDFAYQIAWTGHESEVRDLSRGLCYSTEAAARAVAQAMIAPTKREG